jgi:hypothetical protein
MNRYRGSENVFENVSFNDYPPWKRLWLLLGWVVFSVTAVGRAEELAVGHFARDGLNGWQAKIFEGKTDYRLTRDNGRVVVQATSHAAASGLVKEIAFNPAEFRYLRWSWKIENTIPGGDETTREGDDYAARLYVVFPGLFFWQTRAINYIWANQLAKGESIPNAYTGQAMMLAVQSGPLLAGRWLAEERDIRADYTRLFGEEPEKATAIAIMTDTDNTGESAVAWYGDIVLSTIPGGIK